MGANDAPFLSRLNADGSRDPQFQPAPSVDWSRSDFHQIICQQDKIIITGSLKGNGITRLNADGSRDLSFNAKFDPFSIEHLVAKSDGKLVAAGHLQPSSDRNGFLVQLLQDGTIDPAFAPPSYRAGIHALNAQPDGKLLVAAYPEADDLDGPALVRLNVDGTRDLSFKSISRREFHVRVFAVQPDGKILIGGVRRELPEDIDQSGQLRRIGLRRLHPDGTVDTSFEVPVKQFFHVPVEIDSIAIEPSGMVIARGIFSDPLGDRADLRRHGLIRVFPDGSLDYSFFDHLPTLGASCELFRPVPRAVPGNRILLSSEIWDCASADGIMHPSLILLKPVPVVRSVRLVESNATISIGGEPDWTYRIETSPDLTNWTLLRALPSAGAVTEFRDASGPSKSGRFYRVSAR